VLSSLKAMSQTGERPASLSAQARQSWPRSGSTGGPGPAPATLFWLEPCSTGANAHLGRVEPAVHEHGLEPQRTASCIVGRDIVPAQMPIDHLRL
jgi:hypothetical protein